MKKVLYDLSYLGDGRISGVERYAIEIYNELINDNEIQYVCLIPKGFDRSNVNVDYVESPFKSKVLNHALIIPLLIFLKKFKIVYYPAFPPSFLVAMFNDLKIVRTIHDDVYWSQMETLSRKAKMYLKPLEDFWLNKYAKIITVSEYSRGKLRCLFYNENITVIPNAVNPSMLNKTKVYDGEYLLCVGTIEPRKNYCFAIELFESICEENSTLDLIICGRKGWAYEDIQNKVENSQYNKRIKLVTDADDTELFSLYGGCTALIFPSKSEGFGIPIIEAMSLGKLVVAANNTAITEVVSQGGVLVNGYNVSDWKIEILRHITKNDQKIISKAAKNQSRKYSWNESFKKLNNLFKNL